MNVKRFIARSSREALNQVRLAFGADAVVLSNKPCDAGVEVHSVEQIAHLKRDALDCRPRDVRRRRPARDADDRAAGIRVPVWRTETRKRRNQIHAAAVRH